MGIVVGSIAARASGGTISTAGLFTIHTFTTPGANTFTPASTGLLDILLIGAGGWGGDGSGTGSGGGGAGATVFRKFVPVVAGTPYPVVVGPVSGPQSPGGNTIFNAPSVGVASITAYGGATGTPDFSPLSNPSPNASGGGAGKNSNPGAGANVYGIGFPGGGKGSPPNVNPGGGGGGAGGSGTPGFSGGNGGPGVPIAYFSGITTNIVCRGGPGEWAAPVNTTYGSGGKGGGQFGYPDNSGIQGVAYIRYI